MLFHYISLYIYIYIDISQHAILAYCFSMKTKITMTDSKEKKHLEKGKLVDFRSIRFRLQLWDWIGIPKIQCNDTPCSKPVVRAHRAKKQVWWERISPSKTTLEEFFHKDKYWLNILEFDTQVLSPQVSDRYALSPQSGTEKRVTSLYLIWIKKRKVQQLIWIS